MAELGTNSDSEDFAEVKEWLESCNLLKYFSGFKKHDYDDLKLIREMNEKQIEGLLEDVGITSNGHKLKFMSALTILKTLLNFRKPRIHKTVERVQSHLLKWWKLSVSKCNPFL